MIAFVASVQQSHQWVKLTLSIGTPTEHTVYLVDMSQHPKPNSISISSAIFVFFVTNTKTDIQA